MLGETANFTTASGASTATPSITLPTSVPAGALIVLAVEEYGSEARSISSVAGSLNASGWTLVSGPTDANNTTIRSWLYVRENSAAGSETVTVTFDSACNSRLAAGYFTGARTSGGADNVDATPVNTAGTSYATDLLTASAAGAIIGFIVTNNTTSLSALGTDEVDLTAASFNAHLVYQPFAAAGDHNLEGTVSLNSAIVVHSAIFLDAAGGGGGTVIPVVMNHRRILGMS